MAKRFDFGEINFDVESASESEAAVEESKRPFRILILGDFSGGSGHQAPVSIRRPKLVDRDNFDEILRRTGVGLTLPLDEGRVEIRFDTLDDFHPARLFVRVSLFQKLRAARAKLSDSSTFAEAAVELGISAGGEAQKSAPEAPALQPPGARQIVSRNLLEDAINATEQQGGEAAPPGGRDELASFIHRAMAPHLAPRSDPRQAELLGAIDQAASAAMRALLRVPGFRELEAAWRSVFFLVRRIETDPGLKLHIADISRAELARRLVAGGPERTALDRLFLEEAAGAPGGEPWAVISGNYIFHKTLDDLTLLRHLASVAAAAGAPFIGGAGPDLLGCASPQDLSEPRTWKAPDASPEDEAWAALRDSPEASYLGLALPRFRLRLPYGKETDPVEQFDFEEISGAPSRDDYLWGNSAFLCVFALAEAFAADGWEMQPGHSHDIGGLPLHIYRDDGDAVATPCAEAALTWDAADKIMDAGLVPAASLRGQDVVRLVRLQSIANPLRGLAGRWR